MKKEDNVQDSFISNKLSKVNDITINHTSFDSIDSTQIYARTQYNQFSPDIWMFYTAKGQSSGIGQGSNKWFSPYGVNVYATYGFLLNEKDASKMFHMAQVSAFSVIELLKENNIEANYKWVNDILINRQKVSGILCESVSNVLNDKGVSYYGVLVGIGINVNADKDQMYQVLQPATSMKIQTGQEFSTDNVISSLSYYLIKNIRELINSGFNLFQAQLQEKLENFGGKAIVFKQSTNKDISDYKVGYIKGIGSKGELVLNINDKEETFFNGVVVRGEDLKQALLSEDVINQFKEIMGEELKLEDCLY